jgi:hypothetical protein
MDLFGSLSFLYFFNFTIKKYTYKIENQSNIEVLFLNHDKPINIKPKPKQITLLN